MAMTWSSDDDESRVELSQDDEGLLLLQVPDDVNFLSLHRNERGVWSVVSEAQWRPITARTPLPGTDLEHLRAIVNDLPQAFSKRNVTRRSNRFMRYPDRCKAALDAAVAEGWLEVLPGRTGALERWSVVVESPEP